MGCRSGIHMKNKRKEEGKEWRGVELRKGREKEKEREEGNKKE